MNLPSLIVFDLDFTLWDCGGTWCDCLLPPFCKRDGRVVDAEQREILLYDCVNDVLQWCDDHGVPMALASRTEQPPWARQLISLLEIADRFAFAEIYPSSKLKHFAALREDSEIEFEEMLFFDDELRNIREVSSLGVTCIHVENGFRQDHFESAINTFSRSRD